MSEAEIARLRESIAEVDREIVARVAKRLHLAEEIGLEKKAMGLPVRDPEREERVMDRFLKDCDDRGIARSPAVALARLLMEESVRRQEAVAPPKPLHRRALVVGGTGAMGRWLCRYLRSRGYEVVVNDTRGPLDGFPFEGDLAKGVAAADVVAVSVPVSAAPGVLRTIASLRPRGLVFDICSLKGPIERDLRALARSGVRVGSVHPLFGPDLWPLSQGRITFSDCGDREGIRDAKDLFRGSGASLVDVDLERHDEAMALLLGLSHLSLLAFARSASRHPSRVEGLGNPTGTTFSRLSKAAEGLLNDPPELLRDIQMLNPHTPAVHGWIRDALEEWRRAALSPGSGEFLRLIEDTRAIFRGVST